jgi:hypothetical protein
MWLDLNPVLNFEKHHHETLSTARLFLIRQKYRKDQTFRCVSTIPNVSL